ncbi:Acidic repeat-containing protein [Chionoecetes opilio]|uniref:Acidic repeat-containing protein n=1 Tax=Chionoecetes opilio TaxID=41210 RepID=A0A8J4Y293_CHIOP|nr:Acidic repeat-containing protein [Chionoecetes opilio]
MCSRESSGNSTRLSLDAANLPITPFGMRRHGSPRKLNSPVTNRFNKLSRRRGGDPQGGTKVAEYEGGNKGNIGGLKGGQRRKRWAGGESRDVPLYTVPEDNVAPESSCDPAGEEQQLHHSTGSQHHSTGSQHHSTGSQHHSTGSQRFVSHNLPSAVYSSATNKSTQGARIDSNERRDSVFTDIDEGSFVEFCHDKGKGHGVPCIPDDPIRKINLYYTCESNNDTQYSTSTKTNNAPVGFHKYLDKLRMQKYLGNVLEETEIDAPDMKDKVNINGLYDETIITCSADMHRVLRKGPPPAAINSTVMDKLPLEARVALPYMFLEISTLTGKPETVSDSLCQANPFRGQTGEHEIVVVSESSDEGEAQSGGGGGGGPTNLRQRDSSFDSSFLQRRDEDSYIGESASQAKPSHENESLTCAIEFNHKHLTNRGVSQQKSDSKPSSKKRDSPLAGKSIISSSESECEYAAKRPTGKQRVIVSTSEESGDDKRNGMFVTQRKKKKHSKITSELFESDYIEASDSEEEESLHLRLSKSHNETNKASEKTTKTIGKSATSPDSRAKNFSKTPNTVSQKFKTHQSHPRRVENTDSNTPPVGIKTIHNDIPCRDIRPSGNKETTPPPETVNSPDNSDGDGPLDLSLIRKELDNLYTPAWRKKENAIFKPTPSEKMHKNRTTRPRKSFKGPNRRRSKSCPRLKLESDEEKSVTYEVNEVRSDGDGDTSGSERHVSSENNKLDPVNRDVKTTKISDKPAEDSFEEYLKKVKNLRQRNEQQQKIQSDDEDEDRYEASFINDDDSYSLPMVIQKPQKSPPVNSRNPKPKSRVRNHERHKVSLDDALDTSNRTNEKAAKTPSRPEEDSFEEYIKKARVLTQQKEHQQKVVSSDENDDRYESSFINDGSSDDESFSLPLVSEKHFKTPARIPDYPKHIVKKQDRGTIKTNTGTKPTTTWRDCPTVYLTSDSDSDDVYSLTKTNKKIQPPSSYVTPRTKGRGKVLPKTEGHCRHLPKKYETSQLSPRLPFLASLSSNVDIIQCHPEALPYIRNFKKKKEELVEKLYKYYNTHVFEDKLPSYINIKWNVIDCSERLRDTLIHELCHAAAWIISGYKDGHGPLWKAWAAKAKSVFPELPAISRCHSYQIQCKYTYRCKRCAYSIGRHSKSLDTQKKVCGLCFGRFELLVNSKTSQGQNRDGPSTPALDPPKTPRTPGPFALFVKENYGSVKKSTPHLKHGDVMRVLSTKFESVKTGVDSVPFSRLILD